MEAEFYQAISVKPDNALAENNLGHFFLKQGRSEEAITEFETGYRLDSDLEIAMDNLIKVYPGGVQTSKAEDTS